MCNKIIILLFGIFIFSSCSKKGIDYSNKSIRVLIEESVSKNETLYLNGGSYHLDGILSLKQKGNIKIVGKNNPTIYGKGVGRIYSKYLVDTLSITGVTFDGFERVVSLDGELKIKYIEFTNNIIKNSSVGLKINRYVHKAKIENNKLIDFSSTNKNAHAIGFLIGRNNLKFNNPQFKMGHIEINGNSFENFIGNDISGGGEIHAILARGKYVELKNNRITNLSHQYPKKAKATEAIYLGVDSAYIYNNKLIDAGGMPGAITIKGRGGKRGMLFEKNHIEFTEKINYPVRGILGSRQDVTLKNNTFIGATSGSVSATGDNWILENNKFSKCRGSSDLIFRNNNLTLKDNKFISPKGPKASVYRPIFITIGVEEKNLKGFYFTRNEFHVDDSFTGIGFEFIKFDLKRKSNSIDNIRIEDNTFSCSKKDLKVKRSVAFRGPDHLLKKANLILKGNKTDKTLEELYIPQGNVLRLKRD